MEFRDLIPEHRLIALVAMADSLNWALIQQLKAHTYKVYVDSITKNIPFTPDRAWNSLREHQRHHFDRCSATLLTIKSEIEQCRKEILNDSQTQPTPEV